MTQLYPIGTQLITRRLSQAALAYELGFWVETQDSTGEWCNSFHVDANVIEIVGEDTDVCVAEFASTWRVIVTAENQKWLSPVPMVGDKIQYHQDPHGSMYVSNIVSFINDDILDLKADPSTDAETYETELSIYQVHDILKRTYPNGQRAPLIEFDEVILPTKGEQR